MNREKCQFLPEVFEKKLINLILGQKSVNEIQIDFNSKLFVNKF